MILKYPVNPTFLFYQRKIMILRIKQRKFTNSSIFNSNVNHNLVIILYYQHEMQIHHHAIDDQIILIKTYIEENLNVQHEYTDQEIEALIYCIYLQ
jgi:hypothetical protein